MSLLTPMLRTSPLTDWFSDVQRVQGMLDFEAALVRAEVECGLVPQTALNPIIESCRHEKNRLFRAGAGRRQRRESGDPAGQTADRSGQRAE